MAFESLGEKLQSAFKKLTGKGRLSEKDVTAAMREVRMALLEADVNFKVVKEFVAAVSEKAVGHDVLEGLRPGHMVVGLVRNQLCELMGSAQSNLTFSQKPPTIFMLVGLQGSGKTTSCAKLAGLLRKQGRRPLLAALDIYRPAAIKQLQVLGANTGIPVFEMGTAAPPQIATQAVEYAVENSHDVVLLDTAGRLHIDDTLMQELRDIRKAVAVQEILLVVDAMTGQDAVNVAATFDTSLGLDGIIITKLDSDTRGGAVLSVKKVTGKPIKFVGLGEKPGDIEPFFPDRMASRILGMGDIETLVDKAQQAFDEKRALELEKKMRTNSLTLEDFLEQMQQIKKMGSLRDIIGMIPGMNKAAMSDATFDERAIAHTQAIIQSMTPQERINPAILNSSRKRRIAAGCGRTIQEVNRLLKQFEEMRKMMKGLTGGKKGSMNQMMKMPFMR